MVWLLRHAYVPFPISTARRSYVHGASGARPGLVIGETTLGAVFGRSERDPTVDPVWKPLAASSYV